MLALGKLLELTLAGREPTEKIQLTTAGTKLQWLAEGALEVMPSAARDCKLDLLLSAGLHGNETAPMELLDDLLHEIACGSLVPRARILFLLGNPPAMRRGKCYVDQDINRLFSGRHEESSGFEAMRANDLEHLAMAFFSKLGRQRLHYDLHTSIRGSRIEQFALYPSIPGRPHSRRELARLHRAGIQAVLLQNKLGSTFSSFTYAALNAEAFTLELGKAHPFGRNQAVKLQRLAFALRELIEGESKVTDEALLNGMQLFSVAREIIKHSNEFRLHLPDAVENFSELPTGYLLAEDVANRRWIVEERGARIIFPNPKVRNGLRAGILVVPATL